MALPSIGRQDSFGSLYQAGRSATNIFLEMNETASFVPDEYLTRRKFDGEGAEDPAWRGRSVERLYMRPQIDLKQIDKEVEKLMEPISAHCEMRIQLFYQQLCLFFGSKFVLVGQGAEAQAGMKNGGSDGQLAEAHSSTLPSLRGWEGEQEEAAFGPEQVDITPYSLGNKSSYFLSWNATARLPVFVNKADSLIDFQTKCPFLGETTFREYCTKLLNRVSDGKMNPKEGLANFLGRFLQVIKHLDPEKKDPVLNCYSSIAEYYSDFIKEPENLARLTFEKGPQLPYDQIQKKMWQQMRSEVESYRIVDLIRKRAMERIEGEGKEHHKEYLVPGILLRVLPGSNALDQLAQTQIAKLNENRTPRQVEYARQMASSEKVIGLAKKYFDSFDNIASLSKDLVDQKSKWNRFYQSFWTSANEVLETSPQKRRVIFWTALPMLYASLHPTEDSRAICRFLCISDGWFSVLTDTSYTKKIREYIATCSEDAEIRKLTGDLVKTLRPQPSQGEEKKGE